MDFDEGQASEPQSWDPQAAQRRTEEVERVKVDIARDFNKMLGGIVEFLEFAKQRLASGHPAQKYLLEIRRAADRAVALTKQLLVLTRQQALEWRTLNLHFVIQDLSNIVTQIIGEDTPPSGPLIR